MTQTEIINSLQDKISSSIRVAMPGIIETYDYNTQKASVKIDSQELYNNDTYLDYPIIANVPIIFPRSGGASITMPILRGDTCLVIFLDRNIISWLLGASKQKPESRRMHHLSDAVAIMGLSPFTKASSAENNTDVLITYDGSKLVLKPKGNIDVHSAKEINVKTESVIINCKNANVKAEESIVAECKNAQVKSAESTSIECKNASIKSSETTSIECKTADIKASENVNVECKNAGIKASENTSIECKTASIKASNDANIECQNANVKATGAINTETPNFTQKGNMKIDGNIEITGTSLLQGKLTSQNGIENSGSNLVSNGKTFETHTHSYQDVTSVTAPEGPCSVIKTPTATQAPT